MENPGLVVHGQAAPFSTALRSLVNNPQYSDVCFVVGQERQEVFAHRCLLACRCNFFQRLLGTEPGPGVPSPVVLSTVPTEAFLAVLEFLYANSVTLHRYSVLEVLTAAVEYGLEELREVAVTFGLGPLQERCIAFIEAHSQEALRTRGFLELSASALLPVLRSDKLCVDEAELVKAARNWARVGAVSGTWGRRGRSGGSRRNSASGLQGTGRRSAGAQGSLPQAVLERPVAEVAAPVVRELRLALLAPAELSALEEQNRQEPLIPVRTRVPGLRSTLPRGDEEPGPLPGDFGLHGDPPSPTGGADCGGVEVPCPTERRCGQGRTVQAAKGNPAPGSPPFSGPSFQMIHFRNLGGI
uniref:BTB/POZ domain-containing protein 19 isoform X3 n=1 Tax=Myodes glareolus TaxID=447135 RepID=UPI002021F984|nr:BTB/POZ domain-containing protein 19 isoform X3 [Myodes glareolus]